MVGGLKGIGLLLGNFYFASKPRAVRDGHQNFKLGAEVYPGGPAKICSKFLESAFFYALDDLTG